MASGPSSEESLRENVAGQSAAHTAMDTADAMDARAVRIDLGPVSTKWLNCAWPQPFSVEQIDQIDHDPVDHLDPEPAVMSMLRSIRTIQIQPRKHALDHAGWTAPTRQHELLHIAQSRNTSALNGRSRSSSGDR